MITIHQIASPQDKLEHLRKFDPTRQTWLVNDRESQRNLRQLLLLENDFLEEDAIFCIRDFWQLLLERTQPHLEFVEDGLGQIIIGEHLSERDSAWAKTPGAAEVACRYIKFLMPVLSHPSGLEGMKAWFNENPEAYARWSHWFIEIYSIWRMFQSQNLMVSSWAVGMLANEGGFENVWDRDLILDLGPCLSPLEAEILFTLSRHIEIEVLQPSPSWINEFETNFAAYQVLSAFEKARNKRTESEAEPGHRVIVHDGRKRLKYQKFTTMIAEVKEATAQVREWLDSGIPLEQIAIVAPDCELYWPSLFQFFREEGIPIRKKYEVPVHNFPEIARWISRLHILTGEISKAHIEAAIYRSKSEPILDFEKFRVLYSNIYGPEDLSRSETVQKYFTAERLDGNTHLSVDEFIGWALGRWGSNDSLEHLEPLLDRFRKKCPERMRLKVSCWVEHLARLASKEMIELSGEPLEGISFIDLSSGASTLASNFIFLGLTEETLRRKSNLAILPKDISSLQRSLGFSLPLLDDPTAEFEARWHLEDLDRNFVLMTPLSDFDGEVQAPSLLWLSGAAAEKKESHAVDIPRPTRWDEIQRSLPEMIAEIRGWGEDKSDRVSAALKRDMGVEIPETFGGDFIENLSASVLEDYLKCPFIFASKKLFHLSDLPSIDLDIDQMTKGRLVHSIFEKLTREPVRYDYSDEELLKQIDVCRTENEIVLGDEKLWNSLRRRYLKTAKRFLEFERTWRSQYPKTKTIGREVRVSGYVQADGSLSTEWSPVQFRGSIDRVDSDGEGHAVILDYKTSKGPQVIHYGKWLENNILQLILYAMALEGGLTPIQDHEVIAALYFVVRDLNREYGYQMKDYDGLMFQTKPRMGHGMTLEQKRDLFDQAKARLRELLNHIKNGRMLPTPHDLTECPDCQWRNLCRAPHLL